jgi:hypothetical protein
MGRQIRLGSEGTTDPSVPAAGTPPPARCAAAAARRIELPQHLFPTNHPRRCLLSLVAFLRSGLSLFFPALPVVASLLLRPLYGLAAGDDGAAVSCAATASREGRVEGRNGNNVLLGFLAVWKNRRFLPWS